MAKSKKDINKAQKKADEKAGIVRDPRVAEKAAKASNKISCQICGTEFPNTAKMVEAKQHHESKHAKMKFEDCFQLE